VGKKSGRIPSGVKSGKGSSSVRRKESWLCSRTSKKERFVCTASQNERGETEGYGGRRGKKRDEESSDPAGNRGKGKKRTAFILSGLLCRVSLTQGEERWRSCFFLQRSERTPGKRGRKRRLHRGNLVSIGQRKRKGLIT